MNINARHLLLYLLCILLEYCNGDNLPKDVPKSAIQKLRSVLLRNYDKEARPVVDNRNVTKIHFSLIPLHVLELDEENHILSLEAWINMEWTDEHLVWDPEDYSGLQLLHFPPHEIWKPNLVVYSSIPSTSYNPINTDSYIISFNSGVLIWVPTASIRSYCELDYTFYPNDVQHCNITFGSWTLHGETIKLSVDEGGMEMMHFFDTNQVWKVTSTSIQRSVKYYDWCKESYVTITATLDMKRKQPTVTKRTLQGPSLLAILFTLLMFWLPSNSCQKVNLGCTSIIVLAICLLYTGKSTASSLAARFSASAVHFLLYIVVAALFTEIAIINLASISGPFRPPTTLTNHLRSRVARFLMIHPPTKQYGLTEMMDQDEGGTWPLEPAHGWFIVGTALDRIFFFVYLLAFISYISISGL